MAAGQFTVKRLADGDQKKACGGGVARVSHDIEDSIMATLDLLGDWKRTQYAGDLRAADADKDVVLMGWVHRRRDLGNLIFIDLRDRGGIAQIVFNKELGAAAHARAEELRAEYVVAVRGRVARRQKPNPDLASGEVEVFASEAAHPEYGEDAAVRGGRRSQRQRRDAAALPLSRSCGGRARSAIWRCAIAFSWRFARRSTRWASTKSRRPC